MSGFKSIQDGFSWLSRILLAIVFLYGGIPKLAAPLDFAVDISAYGLLPEQLVIPSAIILPLVELATATGLLFNRRWAVISAILLLSVFIAVLSYGIFLGLDIDCGCFGSEDPGHGGGTSLEEARLRDLLFLVAAGYVWWISHVNRKKIRRSSW